MGYADCSFSGWGKGSCLSNSTFSGYGEFFGGISRGSKFFLTRLNPFPNAGEEQALHETEHVELPNITKNGTEYRCVYVSGSQPGVGAGLDDMPDSDGYMWFLTNWVPVASPNDAPVAGLARVKLQNISVAALLADPENHQFTLTHSWLINDKDGNPEKWDSAEKLCHYHQHDDVARRKTCTGPCHYVWFEQMQPTQSQFRLTYWEVGVADPVVVEVDSPEIPTAAHSWMAVNFDKYHFPAALFWARADTNSGMTGTGLGTILDEPISYGGDEKVAISGFERAGIAVLPTSSGTLSSIGIHGGDNLGKIGIEHSSVVSDYSLGEYGWDLLSLRHTATHTDDDQGVISTSFVGVTYTNARAYSQDFGISAMSCEDTSDSYGFSDDQRTLFTVLDNGNSGAVDFRRNFSASWASVTKGRGVFGGLGSQVRHGNGGSIAPSSDVYPVEHDNRGDGPHDPRLPVYEGRHSYTDPDRPSQTHIDEWEDPDDPDPPPSPDNDLVTYDKWQGAPQVYGSIYPGGILSEMFGAGVRELDGGQEVPHYQQLQHGGVDIFGEPSFAVVEQVRPSRWHALQLTVSDDFAPNQYIFGGGRICTQNIRYPLTGSDYIDPDPTDAYELETNPYAPGGAAAWNTQFPFYDDVDSDEIDLYRVTDCVIGKIEMDPFGFDTLFGYSYQFSSDTANGVRSTSTSDFTPYAPRGKWRDSGGTVHENGILSAGGPLITGLVR